MEAEVLEKQERLEEAWKQMEQALAVIKKRSGNCKGAHFTRIGYKKRKAAYRNPVRRERSQKMMMKMKDWC